jgi:hypothetical protein
MKTAKKITLSIVLFLVVCSGNFCTHKMSNNKNEFGYNSLISKEVTFTVSTINYPIKNKENLFLTADPVTWQTLKDVSFSVKYFKQYNMDFQFPIFGKSLKLLAEKELFIKGYVIPLDVNQGLYALSRYPYSACFFCGKSGPESVVSLKFKVKPKKYKLDAQKTMKGRMQLNSTNPMDFIYIFKEAEEYSAPE